MATIDDVRREIARRELARRVGAKKPDAAPEGTDPHAGENVHAGVQGFKRGALGAVGLVPGEIEGTIAAVTDPHLPDLGDVLPSVDSAIDDVSSHPLGALSPAHWLSTILKPLNPQAFDQAQRDEDAQTENAEAKAPVISTIAGLAPNLVVGNDAKVVDAARRAAAKAAAAAARAAPTAGKVAGGATGLVKGGPLGGAAGWVGGGKVGSTVAKGLRKFSDLVAPLVPKQAPIKGVEMPAEVMAGESTKPLADAAGDLLTGEPTPALAEELGALHAQDKAAQKAADELADSYDPGGQDWQRWLKGEPAESLPRADLEPAAKVYRTPTEGARPKFKGKTPPAPSTPEDMRAAALAEPLPPADMPADVMAAETPKSVTYARPPKITGSGEQLVGYVKSLPSDQRVEWIHRLAKDQGKEVAQAVADAARVSLKLNPL